LSPTIAPQYNLKANSKIDFTHWRHLIVDVQKDMCDPARSLEKFDSGCFDFNESRAETFRRTKALEDVAHSINNFVSQSRSQLRPVWVCYSVPEYAEPTYENHRFYQNQTEPHVIERQENET
jgi:nicotinamidase-related amidase